MAAVQGDEGSLELFVPVGATVWAKSGSATIDVTGITGGLDLNIVGGDPVPVIVGVAAILLVAVAMGALNGFIVSRLKVPSLIATLGTAASGTV